MRAPLDQHASGVNRRQLLATAAGGAGAALFGGALPFAAAQNATTSLAAEPGEARLLGPTAPPTSLYTYGGTLPGPVLRAGEGEELAIDFTNRLPEPTSFCFGGMRVPYPALGVPGFDANAIGAGEARQLRVPLRDPGTYLYTPFDIAQSGRGLAGALVVAEPNPPAADRDLVLLIQDWRLEPDQRVQLTLNGELAPWAPVRAGERVRLRFVNAARGLFLPLRLDDHPAWIVAIDGRPSDPFNPAYGRFLLAPGGRVDVMVDLVKPPGSRLPMVVEAPEGEIPLGSLVYDDQSPMRTTPLPAPTATTASLPEPSLAGATRFDIVLGDAPATGFADQPLAEAAPGDTLVATVSNKASSAASIHLYGHCARLLDTLDDGWKPWWHDTLGVAPGRVVRFALVAAEPGRWPIVARRGGDGVPLALGWFATGDQSSTPRAAKKRA